MTEVYPSEYIAHDCPFILVSGLGDPKSWAETPRYPELENGANIESTLPPVTIPEGESLLQAFLASDVAGIWPPKNDKPIKGSVVPFFKVKAVGRNYTFPPRKAQPPEGGITPQSPEDNSAPRTLHSPISPLSPNSPLFPDGVMSELWLRKHSDLLPCAFISCYELATGISDPAQVTKSDNLIISSINNLKRYLLTSSSYPSSVLGNEPSSRRSKLVVLLLSKLPISESAGLEDRIENIRRITNLDSQKNYFYLPGRASQVEIEDFVKHVEVALLPSALEYYRELSKHARRKKNKGHVPPPTAAPTTTSQVLSTAGWGIRYEFKLGVFAETRQEMDIASKHYETAYDGLISDIFSTTSEWSSRWKEARLLADVLAFRIARCAMWMGNWALSARRWTMHIETTRNLLDTKGKGTGTYGFAAWMSNWNKLLAQLVKAADIGFFEMDNAIIPGRPITIPVLYAPYEPSIPAKEKIYPQYRLHHAGFYYMRAARYMAQRKERSRLIHETDAHDTYLCPDPEDEVEFDHVGEQIELLRRAIMEFEARRQTRMVTQLRLELAVLLIERAEMLNEDGIWREASALLKFSVQTFRKDRWILQLKSALEKRLLCAQKIKDLPTILAVELELQESQFQRAGCLSTCIKEYKSTSDKVALVLRGEDFLNFLDASFAFHSAEAHVGDYAVSQLTFTSRAAPGSAPITLSEIKILFEGVLRNIVVKHGDEEDNSTKCVDKTTSLINLKGKILENQSSASPPSPTSAKNYYLVKANLTIVPGETKILELYTALREAGDAKCVGITFCLENDDFDLEIMQEAEHDAFAFSEELHMKDAVGMGSRRSGRSGREITRDGGNGAWFEGSDGKIKKKPLRALEPGSIHILPKPPKMEIALKHMDAPAFVGETVVLNFDVCNEEDEVADASIHADVLGYGDGEISIIWETSEASEGGVFALFPIGRIEPAAKKEASFSFKTLSVPADCVVEITVHYRLASDPETPVSKSATIDLPVINPFIASYDFSPRLHPNPWPGFFSVDGISESKADINTKRLEGIAQRWCLTATVINQTSSDICLVGHTLPISGVHGEAIVTVSDGNCDSHSAEINVAEPIIIPFTLDVHKYVLDDRRPVSIEVGLVLRWKRKGHLAINSTTLSVPRLPTPPSEPRLLATVQYPQETSLPLTLTYTIENPTTYFLTFGLTMEGSDIFAFHGPKSKTVQLLPLSRHSIIYNILPTRAAIDTPASEREKGETGWIKPVLRVVDRYFQKTLRCSPADDRGTIRLPKEGEGILVWVGQRE